MNRIVLVARVTIAISLFLTLLAATATSQTCYTCEFGTLAGLLLLHGLLFLATVPNDDVLNVLALMLVVFYASHVALLQLGWVPPYFPRWRVSPPAMVDVVTALVVIASALIAGAALGRAAGGRFRAARAIIPYSPRGDDPRYYRFVTWVYIASRLVSLYLYVSAGVGLPLNRGLFAIALLRIAKVARSFNTFAYVPVAWLVLRRPRGKLRRLTILAVVLFAISALSTLSKVALIYMLLPFPLVYYAARKPLPTRLVRLFVLATLVVAFIAANLFALLRVAIGRYYASHHGLAVTVGPVHPLSNVSNFLVRIGSSFDVLALVVNHRPQFEPFVNTPGEILGVVNGFVPGNLIRTESPQWSQVIYSIGHGSSYAAQLRLGTGDNATLPAHLYLNFGLVGCWLVAFGIMFLYAFAYRRTTNVVLRMYLLTSVFLDVSNGSGFVSMLDEFLLFFVWFWLTRIAYRVIAANAKSKSMRAPSAPTAAGPAVAS